MGEGAPLAELEFYFIFGLLFTLLSPASIQLDTVQVFTPVSAHASPSLLHPPFLRGSPRQTF